MSVFDPCYRRCLSLATLADATLADTILPGNLNAQRDHDEEENETGVDRYDDLHQAIQLYTLALRCLYLDTPPPPSLPLRGCAAAGDDDITVGGNLLRGHLFIQRSVSYFNAAMYSLAVGDTCDGALGGIALPAEIVVSSRIIQTAVAMITRRSQIGNPLGGLLQAHNAISFSELLGDHSDDAAACDEFLLKAKALEERRVSDSSRPAVLYSAHCPTTASITETFELLIEDGDDEKLLQPPTAKDAFNGEISPETHAHHLDILTLKQVSPAAVIKRIGYQLNRMIALQDGDYAVHENIRENRNPTTSSTVGRNMAAGGNDDIVVSSSCSLLSGTTSYFPSGYLSEGGTIWRTREDCIQTCTIISDAVTMSSSVARTSLSLGDGGVVDSGGDVLEAKGLKTRPGLIDAIIDTNCFFVPRDEDNSTLPKLFESLTFAHHGGFCPYDPTHTTVALCQLPNKGFGLVATKDVVAGGVLIIRPPRSKETFVAVGTIRSNCYNCGCDIHLPNATSDSGESPDSGGIPVSCCRHEKYHNSKHSKSTTRGEDLCSSIKYCTVYCRDDDSAFHRKLFHSSTSPPTVGSMIHHSQTISGSQLFLLLALKIVFRLNQTLRPNTVCDGQTSIADDEEGTGISNTMMTVCVFGLSTDERIRHLQWLSGSCNRVLMNCQTDSSVISGAAPPTTSSEGAYTIILSFTGISPLLFTFSNYQQLMAILTSNTFGHHISSPSSNTSDDVRTSCETLTLDPILSMANHSCNPNAKRCLVYVEPVRESAGIGSGVKAKAVRTCLVATQDIRKGEEVLISYLPNIPSEFEPLSRADVSARRASLLARFGFVCCCDMCD